MRKSLRKILIELIKNTSRVYSVNDKIPLLLAEKKIYRWAKYWIEKYIVCKAGGGNYYKRKKRGIK